MVMLLIRRHRLDQALAGGASPDADPALAARARQLTDAKRRRELARTFRRLAGTAAKRSALRVGPVSGRVAAAAEELGWLASRLDSPNPVAARGVAQALLLLTDATGPLYNRANDANLADRAALAARNLGMADSLRCVPSPSSALAA